MIYNGYDEYRIKYFSDPITGRSPVRVYIKSLLPKDRAKVYKYIELLRASDGYLNEPYSKYIKDGVRELIVDFARNRHRIFYFIFIKKTIIMLHAFLKKTPKTPPNEIKRAKENRDLIIKNPKLYEED
ncbi:type II toxin-antitoxin system RelE/ParE family toxin [Patescibacteria group bacterium]|nr:type II toxin-antitoxin system RelE/ParE family toxin [Patescibacteria group bacterium]